MIMEISFLHLLLKDREVEYNHQVQLVASLNLLGSLMKYLPPFLQIAEDTQHPQSLKDKLLLSLWIEEDRD